MRDCSSNFSPFSFRIFTFSESYKKHDPEYRREVAKHTAIYGIRPTANKYGISESTVRGFIKSFKRQQEEQPNANFFAFPKIKKMGCAKLPPEEIDQKTIDMIISMRQYGAVMNYNSMIAIAKGIINANDSMLMRENGGITELGFKLYESVSKRIWVSSNAKQRQQSLYFPHALYRKLGTRSTTV